MPSYRLYWLDGAGKIVTADWLEAEDDDSAVHAIRDRGESRACEIWEQKRLVGRVARADR